MIEWSKQKTMMIDSVKIITPEHLFKTLCHSNIVVECGWLKTGNPIDPKRGPMVYHDDPQDIGYTINNSGYNTNNSGYIWMGYMIIIWLVVSTNPSEKSWTSSVGIMKIPINLESHAKFHGSSHHQPAMHVRDCNAPSVGFWAWRTSDSKPSPIGGTHLSHPRAHKKRTDLSPQFLEITCPQGWHGMTMITTMISSTFRFFQNHCHHIVTTSP